MTSAPPATPGLPAIPFQPDCSLPWKMNPREQLALQQLLESRWPDVAIEIGTYRGGSLQILSAFARTVYSIDIDPEVSASLGPRFPDVRFRTGDSAGVLPRVLAEIAQAGEQLGFVLVDGDHQCGAVRRDLDHILQHAPTGLVYVLMHDSFNPACRQGILSAGWQQCRQVHSLEIDFVPGELFDESHPEKAGSMWRGFALAVMRPEPRRGALTIQQSHRGMFEALYARSVHRPPPITTRIARRPRRFVSGRG